MDIAIEVNLFIILLDQVRLKTEVGPPMHRKFDQPGVRTHDLQVMTIHVTECTLSIEINPMYSCGSLNQFAILIEPP